MGTQGLSDMTRAAILCSKLDRLKVVDVFWVEEHETNHSRALMDLEGMAAQDDALGNDTLNIRV